MVGHRGACCQMLPWVNMDALLHFDMDRALDMVRKNEPLLWRVYLFYAFHASALPRTDGQQGSPVGAMTGPRAARALSASSSSSSTLAWRPPVFRTPGRHDKRLLRCAGRAPPVPVTSPSSLPRLTD